MEGKKIKNLFIGLIILILLAVFALFIPELMKKDQEQKAVEQEQKAADFIVLSIAPEQMKKLSFTENGKTITFIREQEQWRIPQDAKFQINENKIKLMLNDLAALRTERTLEDATDLEQYGLGKDAKQICITKTDDTTVTLYVGIKNATTKQLYFMIDEDSNTVYLTSTALDQHFSGDYRDFAVYETFPAIQPASIREIKVKTVESSYCLHTPGDDSCTVEDENGDRQKADLNYVGVLQNAISNINWIENVEFDCKDFSPYGLEKPFGEIQITYLEKETETKCTLYVGKKNPKGYYYVRLNDSSEVHSVREEYVKGILESSAADFWSRSYSFVSIGDVEKLEVTVNGKTHILRHLAEEGQEEQWLVDDKPVAKDLFTDFYYACVSVTAQKRMEEVPEITDEPVLQLQYHLKDQTIKEIAYFMFDQNFYTVLYENRTKAALTNKLYVNTMLEKYERLLAVL